MLSTGKNCNIKVVAYDNNVEYWKLLIVSAVQYRLLINWLPKKSVYTSSLRYSVCLKTTIKQVKVVVFLCEPILADLMYSWVVPMMMKPSVKVLAKGKLSRGQTGNLEFDMLM